jgi:Holliday junction resolvase
MIEQDRQTKIKNRLKKDGWIVVKLLKTSLNGIPDLMCLKNGCVVFIEVKSENGVLSELQKYVIKQLREEGFEVKIWTDYGIDFKS